MIIGLKSIERIGTRTYRVVHDEDGGAATRDFVFTVDGDEIPLVQASDEFERYMNLQAWRARPLLDAVLAFDRAQQVNVPDPG